MRHNNLASQCESEYPGNATAIKRCMDSFDEPWWLGFAAVGVLFGAAAIAFTVYCCIQKYQEKNEAVAAARGRSRSVSPTPAPLTTLLVDQGAIAGANRESSLITDSANDRGSYAVTVSAS